MAHADQSDKRQTILEAASQLMIAQGIENTSLADIARAANMSKGTLYYYYNSKSDLIFDIAEQHINQITQDLLMWLAQRPPEMSLADMLQFVLETMLSAEVRGKMHFYLIQDAMMNNADIRQRFTEKYHEWKQIIEGELQKIIPQEDHQAAAHLLIAAIDGLMLQRLLGFEELPIRAIADYLTRQTKGA
ncbi:MAG: TetR/AcrR family transcriptional regulator [Phototrophicales bacterium]|nr:MAG: TetR/AcrR family transcriptional regulator [Phototrophicales bacterium]